MKVLDLFSGIGGFSLGLEAAGHETVAFCEIDAFATKVLKKNWEGIKVFDDIKQLTGERLSLDGIHGIEIITGGFPCQDLSTAGKQAGISAERSGLFFEMLRLISELRPRYAIFENVTALLTGEGGEWFSQVLTSLASIGYDAEWHCLRASTLGFPHARDRIWIIAYPHQERCDNHDTLLNHDDIENAWRPSETIMGNPSWEWLLTNGDMRDYRKDNGISHAAYRIGALGNAIVPKIAQIIGEAINKKDSVIPA